MCANSSPSDALQPLTPAKAVAMYLDHRQADLSAKSLQNYRYRLARFVDWADASDLDNINNLTGRQLHEFRIWRADQVKRVTLVNELRTLQKFLEFCASVDAVEDGLRERVLIPDLKPGDETADDILEADRAQAILRHLERYHYASREHVILALLWHLGIRLGTLRAIDRGDVDLEAGLVAIRHRPETDTPLKNGQSAERYVNVSEHYCEVIADYIDHDRDDVVDDHGREPLITSRQGRLTAVPIRQLVYRITQPCYIGECPHDRDPATCEWIERYRRNECPSSRSPHAIRRGSITHHLRSGSPQQVVQERSNVSQEVLERHYDSRTEREKAVARREWLEDAFAGGDL